MAQRKSSQPTEIVERGNIYFIYRPKVRGEDEPEEIADGIDDIERFHMVLRPDGVSLFRLMTIGRKRLPDTEDHERNWGFVDLIAKSAKEITAELGEDHYDTKTRGERVRPAARPAGEGVYVLTRTGHTLHLAYALELPEKPGPVQKELNIQDEGSFALSVKNPKKGSPPNTGLGDNQEAEYPAKLQKEFGDRRFATEDTRLLDYAGAEFILIGAGHDVERHLGVDLEPEDETEGSADIFKQLRISKGKHPIEPLLTGEWR
ncbi:hypothetical protein N825_13395 [Skermanella stibiiresistens SB22]|uniref:Uncharacterized protein n=1 Tax=Skermanella stibiiresistens SB22 TaxID=1385369 RepID=W9H3Y1_9PROT|nr:hypothetical protein [Skermanella stibiiresistens]EWY38473.1 hypothetical protein N825_13395 [Skermanella stibiiresistens SB22]